MQAEYRRDLRHSYVLLGSPEGTAMESYPVRMLLASEITGLLKCTVQGVDGKSYFCYDITSRQSLAALLEGRRVEIGMLQTLLDSLFSALENMRSFLLPMDDLILEPELIFLVPGEEKAGFCFLPGYGKQIRQSMRELIEYLLPQLDHGDQSAVAAGYGLYKKIMEEGSPLEELHECWEQSLRSCKAETCPSGHSSRKDGREYVLNRQETGGEREYGFQRQWELEETEAEASETEDSGAEEERRKQILDSFFSEEDEETGGVKRYAAIGIAAGILISLTAARLLLSFGDFLWVCAAEAAVCGAAFGLWILYRRRRKARAERKEERDRYQEAGMYGGKPAVNMNVYGKRAAGTARCIGKGTKPEYGRKVPDRTYGYGREEERVPRYREDGTECPDPDRKQSGGSMGSEYEYERREAEAGQKTEWEPEPKFKVRQGVASYVSEEYTGEPDGKRERGKKQGKRQELPPLYAETELLDEEGAEPHVRAELVPISPGTLPEVKLERDLTLFGKLEGTADVLLDWPGVSRIHAKLWREDGRYFLMDMNSKNGTGVNGRLLNGGEKVMLTEGDEIRLANLKYRFHMAEAGLYSESR